MSTGSDCMPTRVRARQHEQPLDEAAEPLDLRERRRRLVRVEVLQPQAQRGQRRAQLVGRVGDERRAATRAALELGSRLVELARKRAHLAGGPPRAPAPRADRRRSPAAAARARAAAARQRARPRGRRSATPARTIARNRQQREPVPLDTRVDGRHRVRDADGAEDPRRRGDRHGDVERGRAPSVCEMADAGRNPPGERGDDLGTVREGRVAGKPESSRRRRSPRRSTTTTRPPVLGAVAQPRSARSATRSSLAGAPARPPRATRARRRRAPPSPPGRALVARVRDPERHLEHRPVRQTSASGSSSSSRRGSSRARGGKPTPRTVSIQPGSPSFLRSAATWTSIVFDEPYQRRVPDLLAGSRPRRRPRPARRASSASRSNSFARQASSRPSRIARRARRSSSSPPTRSDDRRRRRPRARRVTARIRATSSRRPYGLTT